jgi:RHS repeat-associated protein
LPSISNGNVRHVIAKYVLQDVQGSTRGVMNNNANSGTSTIIARHDYLPFGEEIGSGTGTRTPTQGYGATDTNRQKYGLIERDDTTGLDHTWWRKYESFSGRWTTPDPYGGSMSIANPQSFNRYSYVQNDPVNFVDPTGLYGYIPPPEKKDPGGSFDPNLCYTLVVDGIGVGTIGYCAGGGGAVGGAPDGRVSGGGGLNQKPKNNTTPLKPTPPTPEELKTLHDKVKKECMERKKAEADKGRQKQRNNVGKRIGRSAAWGALRGGAAGVYVGATGGFLEMGWGAIPGAFAGGLMGATFGAAGGVITGGMAEPLYRMYYDGMTYYPALNQADIDCDAEANLAVHNASLLGGKP